MDDRSRYILDLLAERGPLSDGSLALDVVGDQGEAKHVQALTAALQADGLIEDSQFAPGRWQITDAGHAARHR